MGKRSAKKWILLLFLLALCGILLWKAGIPLAVWFTSAENRKHFWRWIDSLGPIGVLVFLLIQILQVVIAIIPGEPVELAAGMLYGMWGGLAVCLAGILIGSIGIFTLVRRMGKPFVQKILDEETVKKYDFLHDAQKLDTLIFLMFLIPGTPKDALTYLCPLTDIRPSHFLLLSTLARIPSVISSTFAGANFAEGNWVGSLTVLLITSFVGLIGIRYEKFLTQKLNRSRQMIRDKLNGGKTF